LHSLPAWWNIREGATAATKNRFTPDGLRGLGCGPDALAGGHVGVEAMRRFIHDHGLIFIFAIGIAVCVGFGSTLEHRAFTPPSPPGQASAVVFVQDPAAVLTLTATVNPGSPWSDKLTVHVKGAPKKLGRWLLIIECPPRSANSPHPARLVSEPVTQTSVPASAVTVYSGAGRSRTVKLGCFIRVGSNSLNQSNTPGYASIGSVTLPALETDQTLQGALTAPTLYEDRETAAGPVRLIEVFPGATCPSPVPAVNQPTATPAISPSGVAASGPSPQPTSASAANPTSSPNPGIPGCFGQAQTDAAFSEYYLPSSVQTKETLTNVNLTGYQVESIFPAPQITPDKGSPGQGVAEDYIWTGLSSLSPSLIVSNLAGQQEVSHYTFLAGILLGIAGGAAASFLQEVWPKIIWPKSSRTEGNGPAANEEILASESQPVPTSPRPDGP
jgi:hypothetical protein